MGRKGKYGIGRDDGMIYITGDTHGEFGRIEAFCRRFGTCKEDVMIILGDAGRLSGFGSICIWRGMIKG